MLELNNCSLNKTETNKNSIKFTLFWVLSINVSGLTNHMPQKLRFFELAKTNFPKNLNLKYY